MLLKLRVYTWTDFNVFDLTCKEINTERELAAVFWDIWSWRAATAFKFLLSLSTGKYTSTSRNWTRVTYKNSIPDNLFKYCLYCSHLLAGASASEVIRFARSTIPHVKLLTLTVRETESGVLSVCTTKYRSDLAESCRRELQRRAWLTHINKTINFMSFIPISCESQIISFYQQVLQCISLFSTYTKFTPTSFTVCLYYWWLTIIK